MDALTLGLKSSYLAPLYAIFAGVLTSLSPCTLAAIPLVMGHVASGTKDTRVKDVGSFLLGMALSLSAVGLLAGYLGKTLVLSSPWIRWAAGFAFIVAGLSYMGFLGLEKKCTVNLPLEEKGQIAWSSRRFFTGFGMGALYGFSASPCSTPALFAILGLVASGGSAAKGALLLLSYSLGQSFSVAMAGMFQSKFNQFLEKEGSVKALNAFRLFGGAAITLTGIYVVLRPYLP